MQVSLIVGTRDSGKSTWLGNYAVRNRASGILSEKRFVEGRFIGYDARLFAGGAPGEAMPFLRESDSPGEVDAAGDGEWFAYRRFSFNSGVFRLAMRESESWASTVIIDEVGPLEMEGRGFAMLLTKLVPRLAQDSGSRLLISVRPDLADGLRREFLPEDAEVKLVYPGGANP
jgi:hypothetical protein